jgi:hypothetical protein
VFTARYALSPYIKQIRFVFKGLMIWNVTQGKTVRRWDGNIEMDLKGKEREGLDSVNIVEGKDEWRAFMHTIMKRRVLWKAEQPFQQLLALEGALCSMKSCEIDGESLIMRILLWSVGAHSLQPLLYNKNQILRKQIFQKGFLYWNWEEI